MNPPLYLLSSFLNVGCLGGHDDVQVDPWGLLGASLVHPWCILGGSSVHPRRRFSLKPKRAPTDPPKAPPERQMLLFKLSSSPLFEPRFRENGRVCFLLGACGVHFPILVTFIFPFPSFAWPFNLFPCSAFDWLFEKCYWNQCFFNFFAFQPKQVLMH